MDENRDERGRFAGQPTDYSRYARGDRDQAALAAKAEYERDRRGAAGGRRVADEDKRTARVGTKLTVRDAAALTERLTTLGVRESDYVRDLILADLGITDAARRPARRQPARKQREDEGR